MALGPWLNFPALPLGYDLGWRQSGSSGALAAKSAFCDPVYLLCTPPSHHCFKVKLLSPRTLSLQSDQLLSLGVGKWRPVAPTPGLNLSLPWGIC